MTKYFYKKIEELQKGTAKTPMEKISTILIITRARSKPEKGQGKLFTRSLQFNKDGWIEAEN